MKKIPKNKQFAFWKYDRFPYCLGGEVTEIIKEKGHLNGCVETKNFGVGYYFTPFLFTDLETGRKIKAQLDSLEEEREKMLKLVYDGFNARLKEIIKIPSK